jgi:hypothetical protein
MRLEHLLRVALTAALLFTAPPVHAAVPWMINYQGRLTNVSGSAITGSNTFTFRLYDAATSGTEVWEEEQTIALSAEDNGVFNVVLGSVTVLSTVDFNTPLWLSVQVGSDSEMTPRQRITAVGYAINADAVDGLDSTKFMRTDIDTSTSGKVTITRAGAAFVITPSSAPAANTKMVDVQNTAGTSKFSVDYEGDVTVAGDLAVTGSISGSSSTTGTTSTTWTVDSDNTGGSEPASGAGLVIEGGSGDASLLWDATNDELDLNKPLNVGAALTASSLNLSSALGPTMGGTGLSTYTAGELLYASAANTLSKLAVGADGKVLKLSGGLPIWGDDTTGTSGYATIQEEGTGVTARATLNFIGGALTAADDSGNSRTNVTLSASPDSASVVGTGRLLTGGAGIGTIGDLSADRTITWDPSTFVNSVSLWDASQASRTLTANLSGATDPVMTFGDNSIDVTTGSLKVSGTAVLTSESDPQVGTLTNTKWCTTDGSAVNCTSDAPVTSEADTLATVTARGATTTVASSFTASANPGLTVGDATTGYLKVGGSTVSDAAGNLTLDSDSGTVTLGASDALSVSGALTLSAVNAASGSLDALTGSGTLGLMNGSDAFRGLYLNYANANHIGSGNTITGLDIAGLTGDAEATEVALQVGAGWDVGLASGSPVRVFSAEAGDDAAVDAPVLTLRGSYDATDGVGVLATAYDLTLTHNVSVAAGSPLATLDFDIGGSGTDFAISQAGAVTTGTWAATEIGPTKGGTGLTTYAQGDLLYASAINTLNKLADPNIDGKVLKWNDATNLPEWGTDTSGTGTVTDVGNCNGPACFTGAEGTTLTSTTGEILDLSADATLSFTRNTAGSITFAGKDDDTTATTIYDTTGAGTITVGSDDVTAITLTTDGTGTGEVVLPAGSIGGTELADADFGDWTCATGSCTVDLNAVALGDDTTGSYAAGDGEAGNALTGDTATAFFSAGAIEAARGGTGIDSSGSTGIATITAGTWSATATTGTGNVVLASSPTITTPTISGGITYSGTQPRRTIVLTAPGGIVRPAAGYADQRSTTGTNFAYYTLNYDAATAENAYWQFAVPSSYTGTTVNMVVYWFANATSGTACWDVATDSMGGGTAWDDPLGGTSTGNCTATDGTANRLNVTTINNVTTQWTADNTAVVQVKRDPVNISDNLAVDAQVVMVKIEWLAGVESD